MCVFISVGQTPRTGISGFYGKYVFKKKLPNSHISRVAIALYDASSNASLYSYWFLLLSDVLIVTTRVCVLWYHIVVYSAIASWHGELLFVCLFDICVSFFVSIHIHLLLIFKLIYCSYSIIRFCTQTFIRYDLHIFSPSPWLIFSFS